MITKQNILKTGMALICLTMGIGILSGCSGNNHQESHTESNNSAQEELHSNVSAKKTRMNLQQNPKRKKLRKIKRCICRIPRL